MAAAAGGLAVVACSGAPPPATRTPAGDAGSRKAVTAPAATPHGSEAESRPAPASAAAPTAPVPAASTGAAKAGTGATPAAAGPTAPVAAPAITAPVAPLPPVVTAGAPPAAAEASTVAGSPSTAGGAAGTTADASEAERRAAANQPAAAVSPAGTPPASGAKPAGNSSVIVVDTADFDPESQLSLAEAAKAEKERKAEAAPTRIVINNKTLHRYAKGGQLTVAEPKKKTPSAQPAQSPAATGTPAPGQATTVPLTRDEKYWRGRALEIRLRWRKASDRIKELEEDVALLRRRFYSQDDPVVRDSQIKPAWDHALEDLRESRATVQAAKKELADFLDEGRIAGALPGWLREGVDLEPKEVKPVDPTQPIETPIYKDNGP